MDPRDVDAVAVAKGPEALPAYASASRRPRALPGAGSRPLYGVSTLEAMALGLGELEGLVCPVMDARREQVYNALFRASGGTLTRLREDRAIALADLKEDLQHWAEPVVLVGDGALLCSRTIGAERLRPAPSTGGTSGPPASHWLPGLPFAGGESGDGAALQPHYLRLSQAERERLARLQHTDRKDNE